MSTFAKAIITDGAGHFELDEVELDDPHPGEVLISIRACGVCHTDYDSMSWKRYMIMGHEGAGVVVACGEGVLHIKPDDRVLLNWAIPCGDCFQCRVGAENICERKANVPDERFHGSKSPLNASFNLGTMATHAIVPQRAVIKIDVEIPFPSAAILGCGVMTGFGSVVNAAKVRKGTSVVVIGTGGVGLSAVQGAVNVGARMIIAVDVNPMRLELAKQFGATHTILASRQDLGLQAAARAVRNLTNRGADYALECTAIPELAIAPLAMLRNGGIAVAVSGAEQVIPADMQLFEWDKSYINPLYGQCRPFRDFPMLLSLYRQRRLLLDEMVTRTYSLSQLGDAFDHMKQGINAKGVLVPDAAK